MSTDREREALLRIMRANWHYGYEGMADGILAAGWRPHPEPGSPEWEAMVERAYKTFYANANFGGSRGRVEAALRAALGTGDA